MSTATLSTKTSDEPVLVAVSTRSDFRRTWDEALRLADIVLDVDRIAARAPKLGPLVVIARIQDAVHDLVLSREDVRSTVFAEFANAGAALTMLTAGTAQAAVRTTLRREGARKFWSDMFPL